eukprot:SAG31_NODE_9366_length_1289_cov_1.672269_1_plen_268_part_10
MPQSPGCTPQRTSSLRRKLAKLATRTTELSFLIAPSTAGFGVSMQKRPGHFEIDHVHAGSAACVAGLQEGDEIMSIAGVALSSAVQLQEAMKTIEQLALKGVAAFEWKVRRVLPGNGRTASVSFADNHNNSTTKLAQVHEFSISAEERHAKREHWDRLQRALDADTREVNAARTGHQLRPTTQSKANCQGSAVQRSSMRGNWVVTAQNDPSLMAAIERFEAERELEPASATASAFAQSIPVRQQQKQQREQSSEQANRAYTFTDAPHT